MVGGGRLGDVKPHAISQNQANVPRWRFSCVIGSTVVAHVGTYPTEQTPRADAIGSPLLGKRSGKDSETVVLPVED